MSNAHITKVTGGVKGGRAPTGRHPHQRFRRGRKHPDRPQTVALRGAKAAVDLGRNGARREGVSSPLVTPYRRPGCTRAFTRRGPCFGTAFPPALPAGTTRRSRRRSAAQVHGLIPADNRERGLGLSPTRVERSFEVCSRIVGICSSRQASPDQRSASRSLPNRRSICADGV